MKDILPLLKVSDLSINFGGIQAIQKVSFFVKPGEIYSIIGPNGAGKTTIFNCISGIYKVSHGSIRFKNRELVGIKPDRIAGMGVARAFQNIALFRGMSVLDNLMSARGHLMKYGLLETILYFGPCLKEEILNRDEIEDIIEFFDLQHVRKSPVGILSYGVQKRVELARALAMKPEILLVDEPVSGMNLEEREDMARYIFDIKEERRITVVLIEHDMGLIMDLSDRISVLNFGIKIAEGSPEEISNNPEVIKAYLGESK
jgi:branched-chain amino acid transport system ATP-binding protein